MPRIRWSERASVDLVRLYEFLAEKSEDAAYRAQETIRREVKRLAKQPHIGRPIEELPLEFRELILEFGRTAYIVRYHVDGSFVVILAIRSAREAGYATD